MIALFKPIQREILGAVIDHGLEAGFTLKDIRPYISDQSRGGYELRQLYLKGIIEPLPGGCSGRPRVWRVKALPVGWGQ